MADNEKNIVEDENQEDTITFAEFLETTPPNQHKYLSDIIAEQKVNTCFIKTPKIKFYCSNNSCNGVRIFRFTKRERPRIYMNTYENIYLIYSCSNCQKSTKTFSLNLSFAKSGIRCYKYGESPPYGPHTPSRLIELIGPDRDLFLQGRRCENQGMTERQKVDGKTLYILRKKRIISCKNSPVDVYLTCAISVCNILFRCARLSDDPNQFFPTRLLYRSL